jgi:N-formylglutamate amidohydrolase
VHELPSPVRLIEPAGRRISPVVVTSPHSGRHYPRQFIDQTVLPLDDLRKVEDAGVDRLLSFQPLPAPILVAEFPRSFVDVNRQYDELDAGMFDGPVADISPVVTRYLRSGLGMIPRKAASQQNIYNSILPADEAAFRRKRFYRPFHNQLTGLLKTASKGGPALLLDIHSMPSGLFGANCDIVIGSNHGSSAEAEIVNEAVDYFSREGLVVKLNSPFSGGYLTRHYGSPDRGLSALQIEICRSHYLNEDRIELNENWQCLAGILTRFVMRMDEFMMRRR